MMSKNMFPSLDRLVQIERRQRVRKWSRFYEAAIRATREEAPPHSRPSQIYAPKLDRWLQALSGPEATVFHLIQYASAVVEALDQYALPTAPAPHFLDQSPFEVKGKHTAYSGTVIVAEELGLLRHHPMVKDKTKWIPFPFIGDLLVFHRNDAATETVNLSVKLSQEDFERPFPGGKRGKNREKEYEKVRVRHEIEEKLHRDVGTRTVRVAGDEIPPVLTRNLSWLHRWRTVPNTISDSIERRVKEDLSEGLTRGTPPIETFREAIRKWGVTQQQATIVFAEAIFNRELRVEIVNEMILTDQPSSPEKIDAMDIVNKWLA